MNVFKSRNHRLLIVFLVGLVVLLFGLVFFFRGKDRDIPELILVVCSSVGASVVASAIVSWLTESVGQLPIHAIVESLAESAVLMRTNQELEITFQASGEFIRVTKRHSFQIFNASSRPKSKRLSMFTDSTKWTGHGEEGGFAVVVEPDGTELTGPKLMEHVTSDAGKTYFTKDYLFAPGDNNRMQFQSTEIYRRKDRIVWTVQDFSDGFNIRIVNKVMFNGEPDDRVTIKINHHREAEIKRTLKRRRNHDKFDELEFQFTTELLPFQGFEVMWAFMENTVNKKGNAR